MGHILWDSLYSLTDIYQHDIYQNDYQNLTKFAPILLGAKKLSTLMSNNIIFLFYVTFVRQILFYFLQTGTKFILRSYA